MPGMMRSFGFCWSCWSCLKVMEFLKDCWMVAIAALYVSCTSTVLGETRLGCGCVGGQGGIVGTLSVNISQITFIDGLA